MAGISEPADTATTSAEVERDGRIVDRATRRFAWLAVGVAAWFIGAMCLLVWAVIHGVDPDPLLSIHAVPLYLAMGISTAVIGALAIRATRQGRGWRRALPDGYGILAVGALVLIGGLIADVGWREGIGIPAGASQGLAPSRLMLFIGLVLIAVPPLRVALRSSGSGSPRWAAVLSASLVLVALLLPGGFHPASSGVLQRAAFIPNGEIWSMDANGDHQTRLIEAHDGIQAWNAVWSPDGKHLAYTRLVIGNHPPLDIPDEADIWMAAGDGSDAHPVVEGPGWQWLPHWSPDGNWIAYTDEAEGGPWAATGPAGLGGGILGTGIGFGPTNPVRTYADIWRIRADGTGSPERLTDAPGDDRAAAYSPDGTELALDSTRSGGTEIWIIKADGSGAARQLTFEHGFTWGATWSPDGSRIAFNAWGPGGGNEDIYVIGADGSAKLRLTTDPTAEIGPAWSPDGRRIAFRRLGGQEPAGGEIWSMAADGSDQVLLSRDPGAADDLTSGGGVWAADGRIAFMRAENPPADADPAVREGLATTTMLVVTMLVAIMAVLLARTNPPFGAYAALLGISTTIIGLTADGLEFIPAAVVAGLIVDALVRFSPDRWKVGLAGAGSAVAFVVSAEVTVAVVDTDLAWTFSLVTGVVVLAAAIGWGAAAVSGGLKTGSSGDTS